MPRLILTTGTRANTADVEASALQVAGVQDAVQATQANAVIVNVDDVTAQRRRDLANLPGVTGVHEDLQGLPLTADREVVEDFLTRVREARGEDEVPPLFQVEATRAGEPMPDGGAIVLPVPQEESGPDVVPAGPIRSADDSLSNVGITRLHERGILGEDIISVVVDTGACDSAIHEDRQMEGADLTDSDDPWSLLSEHGGMSMGIMAGDDQTEGINVGALPESDVFPIKTSLAASELMQAQDIIVNLADRDDRTVVVNNSWGFPECEGICDHPVTSAIESAASHPDVIQVFAAGNEASGITGCGQDCDGSTPGISGPNSLSNVITVAASGRDGVPATMQDYSSRGGPGTVSCGNRKPDVTAPVFGMMPFGCGTRDMDNGGGTSAAAPQVAGAVGLLATARPDLSTEGLKQVLGGAASDIEPGNFDGCSGQGLIQADAALEARPAAAGGGGIVSRDTFSVATISIAAGVLGAALRHRFT